jgi:hypothetical protein
MNLINLGTVYIFLAILMCSIYYGIQLENGGLQGAEIGVLISWIISSFLVASIIFGVLKTETEHPEKITSTEIALMYGLSIGTIISSSLTIFIVS